MEIKTKYDLGQLVYVITYVQDKEWVVCTTCEGKKVSINGATFTCPKCHNTGGDFRYTGKKFIVYNSSTIGKIDIDRFEKKKNGDDRTTYMLYATGVGSGTMWNECDLWPTEEEAQAECDRRNEELKQTSNGQSNI